LAIPLEAPIMPIQEESQVSLGYPTGIVEEAIVELPVKATKDTPEDWSEHECLSRNIYWESKGQGDRGMQLVAQVTMNRVNSNKRYFPNTVCQVVRQRVGKKCTFSWYCDGKSDRPKEPKEWAKAQRIASNAIDGKYAGLTKALYFKRCNIVSEFFNKLRYLGRENSHCFYTSE
jgi:spore germination cell wall hydrolase CwlJ-like protein